MQKFFKFLEPKTNGVVFSNRDQLIGLFIADEDAAVQENTDPNANDQDEEVAYMPWRNAEFVFNSTKPFFDSDAYS